jgi:anti-sigma factor RsiW
VHLDDERLERLIDGELSAKDEAEARAHVDGCAACRRRMAEAERERRDVAALLATVDRPAPRIDIATIARRAAERAPGRAPWALPRWAAVLAIVVGLAGVAYALPGSPVRDWVHQVLARAQGRSVAPPSAVEPGGAGDPSLAGVAVDPGPELRVEFRSAPEGGAPPREGRLAIALTDGDVVHVHAPRGAATFTSLEGRLVVDDHGTGATFEIDVPRAAPRVEIRVGDRLVFLKEGDRVSAPEAAGPPPYVLPMGSPSR